MTSPVFLDHPKLRRLLSFPLLAPEKPAFTWFYCKTLAISSFPRVCRETAKLKICDKFCVNREKIAPGSRVHHAGESVRVRIPSISIHADDIGRVARHFGRLDGPAICVSGVGTISSLLSLRLCFWYIQKRGFLRRFCILPEKTQFDLTQRQILSNFYRRRWHLQDDSFSTYFRQYPPDKRKPIHPWEKPHLLPPDRHLRWLFEYQATQKY